MRVAELAGMIAAPRTVLVVIRATAPARIAEGLRAALGLTLRRDRVRVVFDGVVPPEGQRAAQTLAAFDYPILPMTALAAELRTADAVEVWT